MDLKDKWQTALIVSQVLTSGVIMNIEKSETEVDALRKLIKEKTNKHHIALFNSVTGAIHAALYGQEIVYGEKAYCSNPSPQEKQFLEWLGIKMDLQSNAIPFYSFLDIRNSEWRGQTSPVWILDFTPFGFGPCAGIATDDEKIWQRAERLKIFGAFDLRTMWTQQEICPGLQPTIQFNYRLSPIVAACVRIKLQRGELL